MKSNKVSSDYLDILNRGGLTKPSENLAEYVCSSFAILDTAHDILLRHNDIIRKAALTTIDTFQKQAIIFVCQQHEEWGRKKVNTIITNIFLNNEQKIETAQIRKDQVVAFKSRRSKREKEGE